MVLYGTPRVKEEKSVDRRIVKRPLARAVFLCYNMFMRIYISGAMAKRPNTYKEEFAKAEREITDKGYTVINPAWLPEGLDRNRYMPICLSMVDAADAIYMMDGWEDSKGARLEKAYAEYQDKLVLYERSEDGAED